MEKLVIAIQELGKISSTDILQIIIAAISVVISGFALFYAIKVPKTIASEQNKIALLEKRTQSYLDFIEIFSGQISWPLALANACGTNIERVDVWNKDIKDKFAIAGFLFSPQLKSNIEQLKDLYSKIRWHDGFIEIGLENINDEDDKKAILQLFSIEGIRSLDEDELSELQGLTKKHEFLHKDVIGENEYEYVTINLYILSQEQNAFANKARELQKYILEKMEEEIQISNKA